MSSAEQPSEKPETDLDTKELRKKSDAEKKQEKDSLINLWMQDLGQNEKKEEQA